MTGLIRPAPGSNQTGRVSVLLSPNQPHSEEKNFRLFISISLPHHSTCYCPTSEQTPLSPFASAEHALWVYHTKQTLKRKTAATKEIKKQPHSTVWRHCCCHAISFGHLENLCHVQLLYFMQSFVNQMFLNPQKYAESMSLCLSQFDQRNSRLYNMYNFKGTNSGPSIYPLSPTTVLDQPSSKMVIFDAHPHKSIRKY